MSQDVGGEKILPASPQKKQRARQEGNIPRSQDLSSALLLSAALLALVISGRFVLQQMITAGEFFLGDLPALTMEEVSLQQVAVYALWYIALGSAPVIVILFVASFVVSAGQVGFMVTGKPLTPQLNRINPINGFQRLFSLRAFVELAKSIAKLTLIAWVVLRFLQGEVDTMLLMMHLEPLDMLPVVAGICFGVWWRVALVMLIIGIADYGYQRWQYEQDLRMTAQEAKQEMKEMEGDPHIKRRVRQLQRQMATQRMMKAVPEADVVIINPTHYAIALRYDADSMQAPVVVAKGMRLVAQRIRELAQEHRVPIVQKPALAREIYRVAELNQPVPEKLFVAVAEVLAYVYRIDQRAAKRKERARAHGQPARAAG